MEYSEFCHALYSNDPHLKHSQRRKDASVHALPSLLRGEGREVD
jgi:hypothetical protein